MQELQTLIEAVKGLPTITIWVLLGYLLYKLAVVGSIYGVIRYAIERFVHWKTETARIRMEQASKPVEYNFKGVFVTEEVALLVATEMSRLARCNNGRPYLYTSDVSSLSKAIDIVLEKEKK